MFCEIKLWHIFPERTYHLFLFQNANQKKIQRKQNKVIFFDITFIPIHKKSNISLGTMLLRIISHQEIKKSLTF